MAKNLPAEGTEETHELSFRGLWMPEVIIRSFLAEKINATEAMLLAIIDGFSKNGKCWASNAYLAKRMNVLPRHIQKMLAHLEEIGLLEKIIAQGGHRFLRTVCGVTNLNAQRKSNDTDTPTPLKTPCTDAPASFMTGGDVIYDTLIVKTRDKGKISVASFDGGQKPSTESRLAELLKNGLSAAKKLTRKVNNHQWAEEFRKFMAASELKPKEIAALISWYVKNIDAEFMPQAFSAKSFCEKFPQIQAAKARAQKNEAPADLTKFEVTPRIAEAAKRLMDRRPQADLKVSKNMGTLLAGLERFFRLVKNVAQDWSKQHEPMKSTVGTLTDRYIYTGLSFAEEFADTLLAKRRCQLAEFEPLGDAAREFIVGRLKADGARDSHCSELWGTICKAWESLD